VVGYGFPTRVEFVRSACTTGHRTARLAGSPKFLTQLSTPAVRPYPEPPDGCTCLLLHRR